jgi:PKHD-type hydroxylase
VTAVTRGERIVCVGWVQSLIRQPDRREVLFDLEQARSDMEGDDASMLIDKAISNLLRMWAES